MELGSCRDPIEKVKFSDLQISPVHYRLEVDIGGGGHITICFIPVHAGGVKEGGHSKGVQDLVPGGMLLDEGVQQPDVDHDGLRHRLSSQQGQRDFQGEFSQRGKSGPLLLLSTKSQIDQQKWTTFVINICFITNI